MITVGLITLQRFALLKTELQQLAVKSLIKVIQMIKGIIFLWTLAASVAMVFGHDIDSVLSKFAGEFDSPSHLPRPVHHEFHNHNLDAALSMHNVTSVPMFGKPQVLLSCDDGCK